MVSFLGRLLNIRPGEWPRLLMLYAMALIALVGINWGEAIVQAAFLQRVGVQYLPWVFIGSAACSIVGISIYSAFADRVPDGPLLIGVIGLSALAVVVGLLLLGVRRYIAAYSLLYLVLNVPLLVIYNVHWATYVNGFYDTRVAKRIVPVVGTAARVAGIVAGLSMPLLNRLLSPDKIILIWLVTLLIMAGLVWYMPLVVHETRRAAKTPDSLQQAPGSLAAYRDGLREGYRYVADSPFARWMALGTLVLIMLVTFMAYRASAIFLSELRTTVSISDFVGLLNGVANLVILPIQLFLLSRLIGGLGLGNTSLVYPSMTFLLGSGLSVAPSLATAGLAYVDQTTLRAAFQNTVDNLLYNAVPLRVKGRVRAFIGGLIVPVGEMAAGLVLLTPLVGVSWFLPAAIVVFAAGFLSIAVVVRKQYGKALVDMLEQEDYSSLALQSPSNLMVADATALALLRERLSQSASPELTVFMAKLIGEMGGSQAVPILAQAARAAEGRLRAAILDVLAAADARSAGARDLFTEMLADNDARVRLAAIAGLEQAAEAGAAHFYEQAAALLADPDLEVRARLLPTLLRAPDPVSHAAAEAALRAMLASGESTEQARGVRILGQRGGAGSLPQVVPFLSATPDVVRLAAATTTEAIVETQASNGAAKELPGLLLAPAHMLLHDPIERARLAAVAMLRPINTPEAFRALDEALRDPSPQVRAAAVAALVAKGPAIVPLMHDCLHAADAQTRTMAAVVLARVNPREYAALVRGPAVTGDLLAIYRNVGLMQALTSCDGYPSMAILCSTLREQNQAHLAEIFYLLSMIEDQDAVRRIQDSLRSPDALVRANAAEALEAITSPQTANLISPLFEPGILPAQLLGLSRETWDMRSPATGEALRLLLADAADPWLRAITASALREVHTEPARCREAPEGVRLLPPVEIEALLAAAGADPVAPLPGGSGAQSATRRVALHSPDAPATEVPVLSTIERVIFLKEVPFFQGMTIDQLRVLAAVCEEEFFGKEARIFNEGDPGGALYVVVNGRVGIEQEKRKGSSARVAVIGVHSYFGEQDLFDNSPRSSAAIALQDTVVLRLQRAPLIALARQHPDLSLELINVLSVRLREANDRIADLSRSRPRELHRLFDALDEQQ
jgi:CRP-like cAMP-binding protein/HEAT repeat protein